jgi:hypothetical protein
VLASKTILPSDNAAAVADKFEAACDKSRRPYATCTNVGRLVLASKNGNLARRPAALCMRLGECMPELACTLEATNATNSSLTYTGALDACSVSGVAGGDPFPAMSESLGHPGAWAGLGG